MTTRTRRARPSVHAIATAKPCAREYTLWDGTLAHFGVRARSVGDFAVTSQHCQSALRHQWRE